MTFDVPQFEVTFDIDVNGIMPNVSAQDKSTGEAPNQITTVYAEGSLSQTEGDESRPVSKRALICGHGLPPTRPLLGVCLAMGMACRPILQLFTYG